MNKLQTTNYKLQTLFYCLLFVYIFSLVYLFPIHGWDEFKYAESGNPIYLQWLEFLNWHGRLIIHILARYSLQWGYPSIYIIKSLVIFCLFVTSIKTISSKPSILLLSIFLFINALLPFAKFMQYYLTEVLNVYNYYIMAIFMMIYIQYYINIFQNKTTINVPLFCFIAFVTGSLHEMVIACVPFVITIYILLKIRKIDIPRWFWWSIPFFLLGFGIILLSPGNAVRLDSYGNAREWDFFGQTINWLELGWKKYFYGLIRNIFYRTPAWYTNPGFLPSSWYIQVLIFLFTYLNYKKFKNIWDMKILLPILYWLLSWYTCVVMSASPMYHSVPVEFSKFFLYISLTASVFYYLKEKSTRTQKIVSYLFLTVVLVGQGIQAPTIYKAKQEYLSIIEKIENGEITEVRLPRAMLGNTFIIEFGNGLPFKYPHIKIIE